MDPSKSQVEVFYLDLCLQLASRDPLSSAFSVKHLKKDLETLKFRFFQEGLSFLTKTLPKLGKALDKGLVSSRLDVPREFKRTRRGTNIPAFLQAYFSRVFTEDGTLLDEPDVVAIGHLRQVLFAAYKLEVPYSAEQENAVVASFTQTEEELQEVFSDAEEDFLPRAVEITYDVFREFDFSDIIPRHGPGAVATGERGDDKWHFRRLYNQIHQVFPYYNYFIVGGANELLDRLEWYKSLERRETGVAKVVLVPKDSRGPRLISCEPLEYQWIQQGMGRKLMEFFESHWLTKGNINFTHQSVNQALALEGSTSGAWATIDLKDASDRVSLKLVETLFSECPRVLKALTSARTTATTLPNGEELQLKKFAPMGSAICFPVEAFVFWVVCVAAVVQSSRLPLREVARLVYVYGDDIIIPVEYASRCMHALELVGLRVNKDKCCITGFFKESCGVDAYKGVNVTPLRLRTQWTGRRSDGAALSSYSALANSLASAGYLGASDFIWKTLESVYGIIPYATSLSSFPSRVVASPEGAEDLNKSLGIRRRWNSSLQRFEFMVNKLVSRRIHTQLDSWNRLLRNVVAGRLDEPSVVVLPRSTRIKRGWAAVY